ncbi:MAG TPA: polysaccharide biosynthesis tyrosine autokinase [Oscillatoriaceae cyanobacterium M33_DOE_052]|uniref:Polysaccharide biosynthesis tyrosine autokinase n=1 Tax=Planktothricoides sp. SpSt-374 TaxID=2282167 RepID=A0A7C3VQ23_9CYAN|nr:polysaccharide biosynthesis tyrosine autokinase [Oscillatoriaceae cyanobacterium M33_DOE_052]
METESNRERLSSLQPNNSQQIVNVVPLPYGGELPDADEEELDLGQLFAVIRRRLFVIAGITIAVMGGVWYWTSTLEPEYEGKFQLLVEPVTDQGNQLSSRLQAVAGSLGGGFFGGETSGLDYESQIAVLKSPELMKPLVQAMQSRYEDIEYKYLVGGEKAPLVLERYNKSTKIIEVRYRDKEPEKIQFVLDTLKKGYIDYSNKERKTNISQGIQFIEDQLPQAMQRVDGLQEKLQRFRQQYNLIDPQIQGQQLAEQLTKIDDQIVEAQSSLLQQQRLYDELRKQVGMEPRVAIAASVLSEAPSYQQRLDQLKQIETKIAAESTRFTTNTPQMQVLFEQRQSLEFLLQQEAGQVLGMNPNALGSGRAPYQNSVQVGLIQQMVNSASQIEVLKVRNQVLAEVARGLSQYRDQFPVIVRQYTDLQRELQVATTTLGQLLAQRETLRLEAAQKEVPWEIIAEPQIPKDEEGEFVPVYPKPLRNLVLGAMLGLMLGFGAALLAERLDSVFHTPEDLKDATKLPILGLIPYSNSAAKLASANWKGDGSGIVEMADGGDFVFLEAFRDLNAKLRFLNPDRPVRSLAIVSATASEGKSTVAVNLAHAAAQMGQRVLLVDADLRRPLVHDRLGILNEKGLADVLAEGLAWRRAFQASPIDKNLFILTAGGETPDPIRLVSSLRMESLMQEWTREYDLVIYDTPPLLNVVDGRLLAALTDGVLFVTRIGRTDRESILQGLEDLQGSRVPILGTVANGVSNRRLGWYNDDRRYSRQSHSPIAGWRNSNNPGISSNDVNGNSLAPAASEAQPLGKNLPHPNQDEE